MDNETKIQLSSFEMELVNNAGWILTKNQIMRKAQGLLETVQQNIFVYVNQYSPALPHDVTIVSPKISKGENYLGLPWLMLDYPRFFAKEGLLTASETDIFAIRNMFWWGNFFSTTLHLSGKFKRLYSEAVARAYKSLAAHKFYYCVNEGQWHHHFEKENYRPVNELSETEFEMAVDKMAFIKLATRLSLSEWNIAIKKLSENFATLVACLH